MFNLLIQFVLILPSFFKVTLATAASFSKTNVNKIVMLNRNFIIMRVCSSEWMLMLQVCVEIWQFFNLSIVFICSNRTVLPQYQLTWFWQLKPKNLSVRIISTYSLFFRYIESPPINSIIRWLHLITNLWFLLKSENLFNLNKFYFSCHSQ